MDQKPKYVTALDEIIVIAKTKAKAEGLKVLSEEELLLMVTKNVIIQEVYVNDK